jgi:hypothetical protein
MNSFRLCGGSATTAATLAMNRTSMWFSLWNASHLGLRAAPAPACRLDRSRPSHRHREV